jgi:hypothetical protein
MARERLGCRRIRAGRTSYVLGWLASEGRLVRSQVRKVGGGPVHRLVVLRRHSAGRRWLAPGAVAGRHQRVGRMVVELLE